MTDQQDWDAAATEAGYLPTSEYVARWEKAREAAHEAFKTAREMITENERLREALRGVLEWAEYRAGDNYALTEHEIWEERHTIELARAALQPKGGEG